MADTFDPYYTWMAIPPAEQPPDLYRLVGVSKFEENLDVISYAIDQRMTHIRTFQVGKHAQHSQRLLNELSSARGTLLDPDKKAAYDQKLRAAAAPKTEHKPLPRAKPIATAPEVIAAVPAPARSAPAPAAVLKPVPAQSFTAAPIMAQAVPAAKATEGISPKAGIALAAGTGGIVLLVGLAIILAFRGGDDTPVVKIDTTDDNPAPIVVPEKNDDPVPAVSNDQKKATPATITPAPSNPGVAPKPAAEDTEIVRPAITVTNPSPPVSPATAQPSPTGGRYALRLAKEGYVEIKDTKDIALLGTDFTAEAWVRWTADDAQDQYIFGNRPFSDSPSVDDRAGAWALQRVGRKIALTWDGGIIDHTLPEDGKWHHVAVTSNGKRLVLLVDGIGWMTQDVPPSPRTARETNFYLGSPNKKQGPVGFHEYSAFRLSSKSRYVAGFTPPKVLDNDGDVVALFDLTKFAAQVDDLSGKGHQGVCHRVSFVEAANPPALATASTNPHATTSTPVSVEPVDLLSRINVSRDVLQGSMRMENGKLVTGGTQRDFVQVNASLPPEYVLQATVTRKTNLEGLGIGLVIGRTRAVFSIDAYPGFGNLTGLSVVDGHVLHRTEYPGAHKGTLLTNDRPAQIRLAVKPGSIKAFHNGRQVYQWEGDPQRISVLKSSYTATESQLFVTSTHSVYEISEFKLLPYDDKPASSPPATTDLAGTPTVTESSSTSPKSNLLAPPDDATAKKVREETRSILKEDFASARRPEDKVPLAKKLAGLARTTKDDTVTQYILWEEAWHAALEGGNLVLAMSLLDEEASRFEIDLPERQLDAVKQVVQLARTATDRKLLAEAAYKIATDAAGGANFEVAEQAIRIAASSAAKAGDNKLKSEIATSAKQIDGLKKQAALANQAAERLKAEPDNPKANLAYGRYLCSIKGDWSKGLQHLKKSGDSELAAIIESDEKQPGDNVARLALADKWWTHAQTALADDKPIMLARACYWYEQSVGQLTGLTKERVAKRVKDIEGEVPSHMLKGGSALAGGGSTVASKTIDLLKLIDPARDTIKGNWRLENGTLLCATQGLVPKIHMPYLPPEEYDVKVVFSQPSIRNDLCILAPKKGRTVAFVFGGEPGRMGVLTDDANQRMGGTSRTVKTIRNSFAANRRYTALLQVRNAGVAAFIDGVEIIRYPTDYSDVKPDSWRSIPDPQRLAIGTDDPTIFHQIEITEVTGVGKMLNE